MQSSFAIVAVAVLAMTGAGAYAACLSPAGSAGQMQFTGGEMKFCDGTTWQSMKGASVAGGCTSAGKLEYVANTDFKWCDGAAQWSAKSGTTLGACAGSGQWAWDSGNSTIKGCINGTWYSLKQAASGSTATTESFENAFNDLPWVVTDGSYLTWRIVASGGHSGSKYVNCDGWGWADTSASLKVTRTFTSAGTFSFYYRINGSIISAGLKIDGTTVKNFSGAEYIWTFWSGAYAAGTHTFEFFVTDVVEGGPQVDLDTLKWE